MPRTALDTHNVLCLQIALLSLFFLSLSLSLSLALFSYILSLSLSSLFLSSSLSLSLSLSISSSALSLSLSLPPSLLPLFRCSSHYYFPAVFHNHMSVLPIFFFYSITKQWYQDLNAAHTVRSKQEQSYKIRPSAPKQLTTTSEFQRYTIRGMVSRVSDFLLYFVNFFPKILMISQSQDVSITLLVAKTIK